jgi:hypothetical protein
MNMDSYWNDGADEKKGGFDISTVLTLVVIAVLAVGVFYKFIVRNDMEVGKKLIVLGSVGIGTTDPGPYKLQVQGDINFTGNLLKNGVIVTTSGVSTFAKQYSTSMMAVQSDGSTMPTLLLRSGPVNNNPWSIRANVSDVTNGTFSISNRESTKLVVDSSGNVGVGTDIPMFPLHVTRDNRAEQDSPSLVCQAKFTGVVHADFFRVASDSRIMKNIVNIEDGLALEKLRHVTPINFSYVDQACRTTVGGLGFNAQQVAEHLPDAIALESDFIPDVYSLESFDPETGFIQVTKNARNGRLRLYTKRGERDVDVTLATPTTVQVSKGLVTEEDLIDGKVFVYGYRVDDCHALNNDYLFTLNFAATRELDKEVLRLKQQNSELQARINSLHDQFITLLNTVHSSH